MNTWHVLLTQVLWLMGGLWGLIGLTSCAHPGLNEYTRWVSLEFLAEPPEDAVYAKAYRRATRSAEVFNNFETHFLATVTRLDEDFHQAYLKRRERGGPAPRLWEEIPPGHTGFVLSVFSPDGTTKELSNPELWQASLRIDNQELAPAKITPLDNKAALGIFFPSLNSWSQEYLLLFAQPPTPEQRLQLATPEAKANFHWQPPRPAGTSSNPAP